MFDLHLTKCTQQRLITVCCTLRIPLAMSLPMTTFHQSLSMHFLMFHPAATVRLLQSTLRTRFTKSYIIPKSSEEEQLHLFQLEAEVEQFPTFHGTTSSSPFPSSNFLGGGKPSGICSHRYTTHRFTRFFFPPCGTHLSFPRQWPNVEQEKREFVIAVGKHRRSWGIWFYYLSGTWLNRKHILYYDSYRSYIELDASRFLRLCRNVTKNRVLLHLLQCLPGGWFK